MTRIIKSSITALSKIGMQLVKLGETHRRAQLIERLCTLSDAELAERGLRREDIVRHIYRDQIYV